MKIKHTNTSYLSGIEEVEYDRYSTLYKEHPEKKANFRKMIEKRLSIANKWMWVLIDGERVLGSLSAQPTNKKIEDFVSWEESTNHGTLDGTYDESGKNVYVVNLDVIREGTKKGGQYMLMANFAAQVVKHNINYVFFESRMPGFRDWIVNVKSIKLSNWNILNDESKQELAEEYSRAKIEINGKNVPYDRLLKFYLESGFKVDRVLPNAFDDPESLNFGVIFYTINPLPKILRLPLIRNILALIIRLFSKNPKILDLLI